MTKKEKPKKKDKAREPLTVGAIQSDITRASRHMRTFLTNALSVSGIYAGQDGVILALAQTDAMTAGAIAERLGVKPPTMTRTLARMEAQGFIKRVSDASDGRQMRAVLTDEGRKHITAIEYGAKATESLALTGLSEKEIRQFVKALKKINRNLGREEDENEIVGE